MVKLKMLALAALLAGAFAPAHVAQVVAVGFVLCQPDDFAVAQLAQQRDITFANRAAQISLARQTLGFAE